MPQVIYMAVEAGVVQPNRQKVVAYETDIDPTTHETLTRHKFYPVEEGSMPSYDSDTEYLVEDFTVDEENQVINKTFNVVTYTTEEHETRLDAIKKTRCEEVDNIRDQFLFDGVNYDFGGEIGVKTLQTRPQDITVWLGLNTIAALRIQLGQGGVSVTIRTADNENIQITYAQVPAMFAYMQGAASYVYQVSWTHKDAIRAFTAYSDVVNYNVEQGWPYWPPNTN